MKKIPFLFTLSIIATFFSCGPSLKDKVEKAKQDSIARMDSIEKINPYFKYLGNWSTTNSSKHIEIYATDPNYYYIVLAYTKSNKGELPNMGNNGPVSFGVSGKDGSLISGSSVKISYEKSCKCILYDMENYFKDNKSDTLYDIQYIGLDGDIHPVSQHLICMPGSIDPTFRTRVKK